MPVTNLNPPTAAPLLNELNGVRFSTAQKATCDVSGDFIFITPRPNQVCVVIGDACGRGVPASRLVDVVKPHVGELASFVDSPSELLNAVNRAVASELNDDVFVTAAALIIDTAHGTAAYSNAGHVPLMLRRAGETYLIGKASGPPLGMSEQACYTDEHFDLCNGDVMLMMTDGIVEAVEEDLFDMPRLRDLLGHATGDLDGLTRAIFTEVARLETRDDDRSLIGLEVTDCHTQPAAAAHVPAQAA